MNAKENSSNMTRAVHGLKEVHPDPEFEIGLSGFLRSSYDREGLLLLYGRHEGGATAFDGLMRRCIWRALARAFGNGVSIGTHVGFKHPETFEIGDGVFVGDHAYIQGRHDGRTVIGRHSWIGPKAYFDARDLVLGEYVGWGPGAKVLASQHTGTPVGTPILQTDLEVGPVVVEDEADVGVDAVVLPGVTLGKGCIVGAGAVVAEDVPPYAVVKGVPARFHRWREGYEPPVT